MSRTVCIVQARMGSTRLPGKVLRLLRGKTVLEHVLERCLQTPGVERVVCAVPDEDDSAPLIAIARRLGTDIFRGSRLDVLARHHNAALAAGADMVMRVTSDCPLSDPAINGAVLELMTQGVDYACNNDPPLWPHGLDVECMTMEWLTRAAREARAPSDREHVTPFIRSHPKACRVSLPGPPTDMGNYPAQWRWTLDTAQDWHFLEALFSHLGDDPDLGWRAAAQAMLSNPELMNINTSLVGRNSNTASGAAMVVSI